MTAKADFFYVPVRLDPGILPPDLLGYAHYLLDLIYRRTFAWKADRRGFVYLKDAYLRRVIPWRHWKTIRQALIGSGVLKCDFHSTVGKKAYGYRIKLGYFRSRRVRCTNRDLARKLDRLRAETTASLLPVHVWLRSRFDSLDFDGDRARSIIRTSLPTAETRASVKLYRAILRGQCRALADREIYLKPDIYGRVHTSVTSLPKALRHCLRAGGEHLVGLDLGNAQPLFAGVIARDFVRGGMARSRLLKRGFGKDLPPYRYALPGPVDAVAEDLRRYVGLCESGGFYESLVRKGESRDEVKERLYKHVFYGRGTRPSRVRHLFDRRYPTVAEMLRGLKRENYKRSSWVLQNAESTFFIQAVCGRIMRERPDLILFTIHDSILTRASDAGYVEAVVRDEFRKLGVNPSLKREDYK